MWGPELPWTHFDFLGGWWLWWASAHPGDELALQCWPDGTLPLQHHFPNPFDGWVLGPLAFPDGVPDASSWRWWNAAQLSHHLANVGATGLLARAVGLRWSDAVLAAGLTAASPVMLHEIAGGRTLPGAVWPGLLGLVALLRGRGGLAGLLIGLQGLAYLYTGALFGLVALILRPTWRLASAGLLLAPYAIYLAPLLDGLHGRPPPAGFSELPVSGLLGLAEVPERLRVLPGLGVVGFVGLAVARRWRLLAAAVLVLLVALGPGPGWRIDDTLFVSPIAWAQWAIPGLGRMHHPVRAALLLVPLLAVGAAALTQRAPRWAPLAALVLLWPQRPVLHLAPSWASPAEPPGREAALWLRAHADAVVDLTGAGDAALGLQPIHGRPMLEGLRREGRRADGTGSVCATLRHRADGWLRGESQPGLAADLAAAGFSHVLVVERRGAVDRDALEADLGAEVVPGVYALPAR